MVRKSKSTKQVRAIDRIIKFQIDDGIESLTISGKEVLADVSIDRKAHVTLFLNADPDKINEIQSLVPFITIDKVTGGPETDKTKTVTLSQDLTQFAIEIADNSKELASIIKAESSIVLDLDGLVQQLLEITGKIAELEAKDLEQDARLTTIEAKDIEQDERLTVIEAKDIEQDGRLTALEYRDLDYSIKLIRTVEHYHEEPFKEMFIYGKFGTTHHLRTNIGSDTIRNGIVFITIHRYVGETYDGDATVVGMFYEGDVSDSGEHIVEMKTILSGDVKIHCKFLNNEVQQRFMIYNIPNDSNENYKISVKGFNFVPQQVLVPSAPILT